MSITKRSISRYCTALKTYPALISKASHALGTYTFLAVVTAFLGGLVTPATSLSLPILLLGCAAAANFGQHNDLIDPYSMEKKRRPYSAVAIMCLTTALLLASIISTKALLKSTNGFDFKNTFDQNVFWIWLTSILVSTLALARCLLLTGKSLVHYRRLFDSGLSPDFHASAFQQFQAQNLSKHSSLPPLVLIIQALRILIAGALLLGAAYISLGVGSTKWTLGVQTFVLLFTVTLGIVAFASSYLDPIIYNLLRRSAIVSMPDSPTKLQLPFLLFLRSFRRDNEMIAISSQGPGQMLVLTEALDRLASSGIDTVGIGQPRDQHQPLSFKRYWLDPSPVAQLSEAWKDDVSSLIASAHLIIVLGDETLGVNWEIARIREIKALNKTLYLLPQDQEARRRHLQTLSELFPELSGAADHNTAAVLSDNSDFELIQTSEMTTIELSTIFWLFLRRHRRTRRGAA